MIPPSRDTNPFSSCWLGPSGVDYVATDGNTPEVIVELLAANEWRGQIVGKHGVGKSTLLRSMQSVVESRGRNWVELRFYSDWEPSRAWSLLREPLDANSQLVIDGYEQLGRLARTVVRWRCWRSGAGLLVTTHERVALPTLVEVRPNVQTALAVYRGVVGSKATPVSEADARQAFIACNADIRQMLDKLYDQHERHERNERAARKANRQPPRRVPSPVPPMLLD